MNNISKKQISLVATYIVTIVISFLIGAFVSARVIEYKLSSPTTIFTSTTLVNNIIYIATNPLYVGIVPIILLGFILFRNVNVFRRLDILIILLIIFILVFSCAFMYNWGIYINAI